MYAVTALLQLVSIQAVLRSLELALHLYTNFFPEQAVIKEHKTYDFIIVGAGSAGCVLARRLSDNPKHNVLLIEAGDNPTLTEMLPGLHPYSGGTPFSWNYTSLEDKSSFKCFKNNVFQCTRGHGLGGTSGLNYMMYVRGDPDDFNRWAKISNNPTWNYTNVLPYFMKSERMEDEEILNSSYKIFHGTNGEMRVTRYPDPEKLKYLKSLEEIGHKTLLDTNGDNTLGFTYVMYNAAQRERQSSCYCFVSPVKDRNNLHVLKNTRVTKVILKNKKAVGVEIITDGKKKKTVKAKLEVILSAGTYNSPQLLMLSGIGPKQHLEPHKIKTLVDSPVGFNLQDHYGFSLIHVTEPFKKSPAPNFFAPAYNFLTGFVSLNKSQTRPDAQIIMGNARDRTTLPNLYAYYLNVHDDITEKIYKASEYKNKNNTEEKFIGRETVFTAIYDVMPHSRGRVMLRSADPLDSPALNIGIFSDKRDLDKMIRVLRNYLAIENTTYYKSVNAERVDLAGDRCKDFPKDSDEYWRCYLLCLMTPWYHPTSSCSMGSVVDSHLRVIGVSGLRVVDASVMPTIPSANTHAATVMIAEKAADMIKEDHH